MPRYVHETVSEKQRKAQVYASSHHGTKKEGEGNAHLYNTTKEGKPKSYIKITDKDVQFLKQHKKEQLENRMKCPRREYHDHNLVFCRNDGTHLRNNVISKAFSNFIKSNQLGHVTFHSLRHTHCTLLLAAGVPVMYVAQRVGHSSTATMSKNYTHVEKANAPHLGEIFENILEESTGFSNAGIESAEKKAEALLDSIGA